MHRLRVEPVQSAHRLASAASPGALGTEYDTDGDVVLVEDYDEATDLVEQNWNVEWADGDPGPPAETCQVVKQDGEVCGRDLPCRFHSE